MTRWTTEIRRDREVYAEYSEWWDSQEASQSVPFLNSQILACWEEGFDDTDSRRHVLLLRRDGELVAGLPLYRAGGRLRTPGRDHADSIDVVAANDPEVVSYLPTWLDSQTLTYLYRFRETSSIVAAAIDHPRWQVAATMKSPYVDLTEGIDVIRSGLGKDFARTLRRRRRRLDELGPVTYVDHPAPADIDSVLVEGLRLEAEGWKGREGVAVLNRPTHERWYRSVAEVAEENGWLRLSALYLDDRMVAFRYDLQYAGRRYGQISSYDESPDVAFSTGSLLLESSLEASASEGVSTYEFGFGAHPWKYDWTSNERSVYDVLTFGTGLRGRSLSTARRVRQALGRARSRG